MPQDITVTLSNEQVAAALEDARYLYPEASNEDLRDILEEAAQYGPGIYDKIREWRSTRVRQEENENRQVEEAAFDALFPPLPEEEEPEPEPPAT